MNRNVHAQAIRLISKIDQAFDLSKLNLNESEREILDLARREAEFYGLTPALREAAIQAGAVGKPTRKAKGL